MPLQIIIMTKFYYPQFCLVMIQINIQKFLGFLNFLNDTTFNGNFFKPFIANLFAKRI